MVMKMPAKRVATSIIGSQLNRLPWRMAGGVTRSETNVIGGEHRHPDQPLDADVLAEDGHVAGLPEALREHGRDHRRHQHQVEGAAQAQPFAPAAGAGRRRTGGGRSARRRRAAGSAKSAAARSGGAAGQPNGTPRRKPR